MADYDVIVVGAGPTGEMMAGALRAKGYTVCNLELNSFVGGLASNSHKIPGYVHNTGMWFMMFMKLKEMWDTLELDKYGCELLDPEQVGIVLPEKFGDPILRMVSDPAEQFRVIAEDFGQDVAQGYMDFMQFIAPFAFGLDPAMQNYPTSMAEIIDSIPSREGQQATKDLFYRPLSEILDRFLPRERAGALRGFLELDCCDGFYGGPMSVGSALTLAYHLSTPSEASVGSQYKIVKGHIGNFCEAIARSNVDHGVDLRLNSEVKRFLIKDGACYGVELANGEQISARVVVSSLDTYNTFINCMDPGILPNWLEQAIRNICYTDHFLQFHMAFNKLPEFCDEYAQFNEGTGWRFNIWAHKPTCEQQWNYTKLGQYPPTQTPSIYFPSILDPSLAPEGHHTATMFNMQGVPVDMINYDTAKYEDIKKRALEDCIKVYEEYMPDFESCIDDVYIWGPKEYQEAFHNTGGTWTHGMIRIDQMFDNRPVKGMSNFRGYFKNLYLCGTSNHPGPGVTGAQIPNCLRAIEEDHALA